MKGYNKFSDPSGRSGYGGYGNAGSVQELFSKQITTGISFDEAHKQPVEVSPVDPNTPPMAAWDPKVLNQAIIQNINRCRYKAPTPIQKYGIPIAIGRRNIVACAQTGSGKTAAFLLPTIHILLNISFNATTPERVSKIGALVLAPSRELATQIFEEAQKFCYQARLRPAVVYGGADFKPQIDALSNGVEILIATPGRFIDHYEKGRVSLVKLALFIADEADRMLDMGFEPQLRQIATKCSMPRNRQTLMFSATFPPVVQRLAQDFVGSDYTFMTIGRVGSTHTHIKQALLWVEDHEKRMVLIGILIGNPGVTLVFCNTKQETNGLCRFLRENGFSADSIHGDRTQAEREAALARFKSGQTTILCATDVAARGLDIQGVMLVVQYDLPTDVDDYVHRMGRTGRAGNQGIAIGFANQRNKPLTPDLFTLLSEADQPVPSWLKGMAYSIGGPSEMKTVQFGGQDVRVNSKKAAAQNKETHWKSFDENAYGAAGNGT
eukprot:TRINITY_DN16424_c0_g1_i1.p1 TRINITY_DN16424_c0_g1~~TRINITY_DN16424_c0_g1_i1.p1  ORF type:complete len:511 (+),score=42.37 TRINITY_DN16424_c0_g1_i1:52-1533(+)